MNAPKKVASLSERLAEAVRVKKVMPIDLSRVTGKVAGGGNSDVVACYRQAWWVRAVVVGC
jgi:hypothetical protein